jgi:hypothetical protein
MPRLGAALSARIHLDVQLGALLVPSLLVTGEPNKIQLGTSAIDVRSRGKQISAWKDEVEQCGRICTPIPAPDSQCGM